MPLSAEERFPIELIKLLLQVAWSDMELAPEEIENVMAMGRRWNVSSQELQPLHDRLLLGEPLPPPDLTLLRTRPQEVLAAARELANADGKVTEDEREMLTQIQEMLGMTSGV